MVCETRIFAEIGLFDTKLQRREDWDWLLRLTARWDLAGRAAAACAQRLKRCNRAPLGLTNTRQSNPTRAPRSSCCLKPTGFKPSIRQCELT
jgi:hypothetical protein